MGPRARLAISILCTALAATSLVACGSEIEVQGERDTGRDVAGDPDGSVDLASDVPVVDDSGGGDATADTAPDSRRDEPDRGEPDASEPDVAEPDISGPDATEPDAPTEPDVADEPDATREPDATDEPDLSCTTGAAAICDGLCVDLQTDEDYCGDCLTACLDYEVCELGICGLEPGVWDESSWDRALWQ